MIFHFWFKLALGFLLVANEAYSQCTGTLKKFSTMPDTTTLKNPEKGYYHIYEIPTSNYKPVNLATMQGWWTKEDISLVLLHFVLDNFLQTDISTTILNQMRTDFDTVRSAGLKSIVRFSYTTTYGDTKDATLPQVLKHIQQLKPILQANNDVILVLQAGFVGNSGVWFFSDNYATAMDDGVWYEPTDAQNADRERIVRALLDALPENRMVQLRTPAIKQEICGNANLQAPQAFNRSNACSRLGVHNDCFMSDFQDAGTFLNDADRTWFTNEARFVMSGGEPCEAITVASCREGRNQIARQRITYFSIENEGLIINQWKVNKCLKTNPNLMGYRFELVNGTFPATVRKGAVYCATIRIRNTGVAPLYNARPVQVLLRNRATRALSAPFSVTADPRLWAAGTMVTIRFTFTIPATQVAGIYDVLLNLPDAAPSLANNPNYRILLANSGGVQEPATRYNIIAQVTIQ